MYFSHCWIVRCDTMTQEIRLWKNQSGDHLTKIESSALDLEKRLEAWIEEDISMISDDLLIIGRQVETEFGGKIDLLGIDLNGDLTIIELKRDKTPRDITSQTLDYASWIKTLNEDDLTRIANGYLNNKGYESFESVFKKEFATEKMPDELNHSHNMLIVATQIDPATERIIDYLTSTYEVSINAVTFQCFKDENDEYIARTFLIEPDQRTITQTTKRGIRLVPPKGNFDDVELKNMLKDTLNHKARITPKLVCFLNLLLSEDRTFGREEIKKKFRDEGISESERQSGTHLTNVSQIITGPSSSHLQQIIDYDKSGWNWKDNYRINPKYRDLVSTVLNELKEN